MRLIRPFSHTVGNIRSINKLQLSSLKRCLAFFFSAVYPITIHQYTKYRKKQQSKTDSCSGAAKVGIKVTSLLLY